MIVYLIFVRDGREEGRPSADLPGVYFYKKDAIEDCKRHKIKQKSSLTWYPKKFKSV